ncbi:methylated-DNA--[protein]-cysteine S-methyltransferase [Corynebacterium pyruviciproducens]|uniref:methylated-DNA--[protein]-cysteine S-methyltransferase n=1 Tax=Corynebacterium pyruviciproducens TaxID=598660 RepID=UPI00254FC842|nr:methylated-DNA--[protein]-cysteine S-methyltransferase [Corynebacterium pyruviciproducens]MDK6567301.1 methylated-DNA--[protein]-cysteine S-methyltransferase [Corynebacterium pyruviciproducens]
MIYTMQYESPLGPIVVSCDDDAITGLWFEGQKYFGSTFPAESPSPGPATSTPSPGPATSTPSPATPQSLHPLLAEATRWLDIYFSGRHPDFTPPLRLPSTPFRALVSEIMLAIPYGTTTTYAAIAAEVARRQGRSSSSAQAVGGAVGHNPISLIIPCHRVVGSNGSLTGYAGGLRRKVALLTLEGTDTSGLFSPRHPTA